MIKSHPSIVLLLSLFCTSAFADAGCSGFFECFIINSIWTILFTLPQFLITIIYLIVISIIKRQHFLFLLIYFLLASIFSTSIAYYGALAHDYLYDNNQYIKELPYAFPLIPESILQLMFCYWLYQLMVIAEKKIKRMSWRDNKKNILLFVALIPLFLLILFFTNYELILVPKTVKPLAIGEGFENYSINIFDGDIYSKQNGVVEHKIVSGEAVLCANKFYRVVDINNKCIVISNSGKKYGINCFK